MENEKPGTHVEESEYRYPGPKPQFREAALVMLADCVEAAVKSLPDPTPQRIQQTVQKVINRLFVDGQFNECELTLKDLHSVAKDFNKILVGIYHHRPDYPEAVEVKASSKPYHENKENGRKDAKIADTKNAASEKHTLSEEEDKENLKRLGI